MRRIMLLATAMVLMPVYAMASANQSGRAQAPRDSIQPEAIQRMVIPRPILPCTPLNPCAVPPPAIGAAAVLVPDTQARAGTARQVRQTR